MHFQKRHLRFFHLSKKKTELEKIEDIEYLRFLELGVEVRAIKMSKRSVAVDTTKDVIRVKRIISKSMK